MLMNSADLACTEEYIDMLNQAKALRGGIVKAKSKVKEAALFLEEVDMEVVKFIRTGENVQKSLQEVVVRMKESSAAGASTAEPLPPPPQVAHPLLARPPLPPPTLLPAGMGAATSPAQMTEPWAGVLRSCPGVGAGVFVPSDDGFTWIAAPHTPPKAHPSRSGSSASGVRPSVIRSKYGMINHPTPPMTPPPAEPSSKAGQVVGGFGNGGGQRWSGGGQRFFQVEKGYGKGKNMNTHAWEPYEPL